MASMVHLTVRKDSSGHMGFAQRERRRKAKVARDKAQAMAHKTGSASSRWYLTLVTKPCSCNKCARHFRGHKDDEIVYRKTPTEILCLSCADKQGVKYRPSRRWEESRSRKRG